MQIRPTAFTIGLIIHFSIALFCVYTELGIDSNDSTNPDDIERSAVFNRCNGSC